MNESNRIQPSQMTYKRWRIENLLHLCARLIRSYPRRRKSRGQGFYGFIFVLLSVFLHDISNIDTTRIIKLGIEMFHDVSWKPVYFSVKRSRSRVTKTLSACVFAFLWVLASSYDAVVYCITLV